MMATVDSFKYNHMISPRPIVMITDTKAATKWYSEDDIAAAMRPKELIFIDWPTHADWYDLVDVAGSKSNMVMNGPVCRIGSEDCKSKGFIKMTVNVHRKTVS